MSDRQETVTVTFNPANIGPNTSPVTTSIPSEGLSIPQGTTIITFNLVTLGGGSGGQAAYPQSPNPPPIQFADGSFPPLTAPFSLLAWGLQQFQLQDVNDGLSAAGTYTFTVFVEYGGQRYSGDPVIINEPPA
jgi:hypothetical protein